MADHFPQRVPIPPRLRFEVLKRSGYACHYCGATPPDVKLQIDHVVPVSRGRTNDLANLVAVCEACNSGKGTVLLIEDGWHEPSSVVRITQSHLNAALCYAMALVTLYMNSVVICIAATWTNSTNLAFLVSQVLRVFQSQWGSDWIRIQSPICPLSWPLMVRRLKLRMLPIRATLFR